VEAFVNVLRQYERWECIGDGYPQAWHHGQLSPPPYEFAPLSEHSLIPAIKDLIREQADHRCLRCRHPYKKGDPRISEKGEWSPCDEQCMHGGHLERDLRLSTDMTAWEARWRILTVHHLDEDKANCRWWNLVALCQRCHLRMQRAVIMNRPWHFEHSEWFKPYAAGFYAWKYLGEDLGREETLQRLPELLALEHRFTQEALL
jgi:hypothetical protein